MKNISLAFALLFSLSVLSPSGVFADARSFELGVNALISQSYASRKACGEYRAQLMKLDKPGIAVFRNRATALAVMKKLARYPGTPPSASKAFGMAMGNLPSGIDWSWFTNAYGSMQGACGVMESSDGLNRLFNSMRVLRFVTADRTELRSLALSFVSKNTSQPNTLIVGLIQLSLFERLADMRLITLTPAAAKSLKSLIQDGDRIRGQIANRVRARKKATDQERASDFIFELRNANALRIRFLPLLRGIKT